MSAKLWRGVTNDMTRKICVVVASRANYASIKSVLRAIQAHPALELQLIISASALLSRFGNVIDVIRADGFEPNRRRTTSLAVSGMSRRLSSAAGSSGWSTC